MRLWHQKLIPYLDRQRLLGQHRECAALRGKGWGKKHKIVDYVFSYNPEYLVAYHYLIMDEMEKRGYKPDPIWRNPDWRGSSLGKQDNWADQEYVKILIKASKDLGQPLYSEHNEDYLIECLDNLKEKGIQIQMEE